MKVALVHDYLNQYGGAERVLEALCSLFPGAPIYTLFYDAAATGYAFEGHDIRTSFLQRVPFARSHHRYFPMLMPIAIEQFDFSQFDLVISSSASYAKGIITGPGTKHICYCHTPTRYAWTDLDTKAQRLGYPKIIHSLIPLLMPYIRVWDKQSSARPDVFLANSNFVKKRIAKYYRREAEVVYPPLNFSFFSIQQPQDYYLMIGRIVPYKRFDIAIQACANLGLKLKVIGDGPQRKRLQRLAGRNTEFLGLVSEEKLPYYYSHARALIFPQEEDFGISALESMASGRPVIAYRAGGALEYIKEESNGVFFDEQTPESLAGAIGRFEEMAFNPSVIRQSVEKYDVRHFIAKMEEVVKKQNFKIQMSNYK
ncbi:MAG: glycosyltransferase [Candidatus Spechtbacteria bacterium]|nr:glycosyltransferase [Candidatus Spechtbacteria bacterium]